MSNAEMAVYHESAHHNDGFAWTQARNLDLSRGESYSYLEDTAGRVVAAIVMLAFIVFVSGGIAAVIYSIGRFAGYV